MLALTIWLPWPVLVYLVMSIVTFAVYFLDKSRAKRGRWRISEGTLHLLELLCGWPGAFMAQHLLRHKSRKADYQIVFWLIVIVHGVFWSWRLGWIRV